MLCMPAPQGTPDIVCGKKRSFMACCVFQIIWILLIHFWLSPLITSNTDGNNMDCFLTIMVPRNTVWKACVTNSLEINCTIGSDLHCWKNVMATWCKLDDKNECRPVNRSTEMEWIIEISKSEKMMFLKFKNISMRDAGLYRCEIKSSTPSVSHAIKVTVTDNVSDCNSASDVLSQENNTTSESLNPRTENSVWLQFYVYICSGVGVLIFIVVVSVIAIRCRGQKKSMKTIYENQSTATPVADNPPPIYPRRSSCKPQTLPAQISSSISCTYDTPTPRMTSLRDRSSAGKRPVNQEPPRQCHNRDTVEKLEEKNPLIYASLNHNAVSQRPARIAHVQIKESEYAAIKVT